MILETPTHHLNNRSEQLHAILKKTFGYLSFRFEQFNVINSILDGKDTLGIMPTGGGKSLCYQIPALYLDGVTLVISPLISLMLDQVMNLKEYGVPACFLNSSLSSQEKFETRKSILQGKVKLIYVSPEGILSPGFLDFFRQIKVSLIAIDEAHCVSQWGHEFRKDYIRLHELHDHFPNVPLVALTATADEKTRIDISNQLRLRTPEVFVSSFDRPNIKYMILERSDEIKQLHQFIQTNHPKEAGIVYCLSRNKVERVADALQKKGYPAVPYHAGLTQAERSQSQKRFNEDEHIIVVATIAFGMGIDRPDVRFVAHLDLPKSIEGYYQETGRAGRDGKPSNAWMVYGLQDVVKLSQMLELSEADESYKKVARHKLDSMLALCETASCKRKCILNYFGQEASDLCAFCDSCLNPPITWDATVDSQKMISTLYRLQYHYGAGYIIDVLRGSQNTKVSERGHDKLSVYGIGKDKTKEHWNSVLRQLLNMGYIAVKNWEYRSLGLTVKCDEVLKGGKKLSFRKQELVILKKSKKETGSRREVSALHGRDDLFLELKSLRMDLARDKGVPPYLIFSDKSLNEMCAFLPRNDKDFLMISGVGQAKNDHYGKVFLKVIRDFKSKN